MLRLILRFITVAALIGALATSIWWWIDPRHDSLQAPSTALALIAAVTGIPADRWAAEAQRRSRALASLRRELDQNRAVLADPRFRPEHQGLGQVYPRLMLGAVDTAFIGGALSFQRDRDLIRTLLDWRNAAEDLNRRLDITEQRLCTIDNLHYDELASLRDMGRPGGYFSLVCDLMDDLETRLDGAMASPSWRRWPSALRPPHARPADNAPVRTLPPSPANAARGAERGTGPEPTPNGATVRRRRPRLRRAPVGSNGGRSLTALTLSMPDERDAPKNAPVPPTE